MKFAFALLALVTLAPSARAEDCSEREALRARAHALIQQASALGCKHGDSRSACQQIRQELRDIDREAANLPEECK